MRMDVEFLISFAHGYGIGPGLPLLLAVANS